MHLKIVHTTGYEYGTPSTASYNEARLTPQTQSGQLVVQSRIDVTPKPWSYGYRDYWGTQVTAFEVLETHAALKIVGTSIVHTTSEPVSEPTLSWEELSDAAPGFAEYLMFMDRARPPEDLLARVAPLRDSCPTPAAAAQAVFDLIHDNVEYRRGTTEVETIAAEAWAQRSGVCQDIAHLTIGALRALGIPARYVSGYLHPHLEPVVGEPVMGESHAWVQWWAGEWRGWDTTNETAPGERHVVLATGRNYDDVRPLAGIYCGSGQPSRMWVNVEVTRLV